MTFINTNYIEVQKGKNVGIVSHTGKELIPVIYKEIKTLNDSKLRFCLNHDNKYAVFSPLGKRISEQDYDSIESVNSDKIKATIDGTEMHFTNDWKEIQE